MACGNGQDDLTAVLFKKLELEHHHEHKAGLIQRKLPARCSAVTLDIDLHDAQDWDATRAKQ